MMKICIQHALILQNDWQIQDALCSLGNFNLNIVNRTVDTSDACGGEYEVDDGELIE